MAMSMKDFLNLYFRQLHFNSMPEPVRARFDDYVKKQDFRGDMKSWADDLLAKNADGKPFIDKDIQPDGHFVHKKLPDALAEFSDEEWDKLYITLQHALIGMDLDRDSLDKKTVKFLDEYFGAHKVFEPIPLDGQTMLAVGAFYRDVLNDENGYSLFNAYAGVEDATKADYEEFKKSVARVDYEKKADVRKKLVKMVKGLQNVDLTEYQGFQEVGNKLNDLARAGELTKILNGLSQEKEPGPADRNKLKSRYADILTALHNEPKIADDFKRFDNGKISKPMEDAIAKTDYTGTITKKDFVPEKVDDRKTLRQRIEGKAHDIYDDVFKKWMTLHRDHIYVLPNTAKPIVDVMTSKDFNLKPTDGIKAMLDKADAIAGKLQAKSPRAADHFDWFVKTMKSLSNTDAFKSALRNGHEMHQLITNVWDKAVADNKIEEAKTAMEVLNVMSYGLLDSRTMNAINQMDFTIASDPGLSWNKNPGVKAVTGALDKTLKFAVKGIGYTVTGGVNLVRRIGTSVQKSDKDKYLKNNTILQEAAQNRDIQNAKDQEELDKLNARKDAGETGLEDEIAFYDESIKGRNTAFQEKDKKTKDAYSELMAFWKLLRTGHTKTFFRISTARVQKKIHEQNNRHADGKMQEWLKAYKDQYMDYAA